MFAGEIELVVLFWLQSGCGMELTDGSDTLRHIRLALSEKAPKPHKAILSSTTQRRLGSPMSIEGPDVRAYFI